MQTTLQALLTDTFPLRRAWVLDGPEHDTDVLPLIYGDLVGGKGGVSYCPGIVEDTNTYEIADHAVVSQADGNSPTFYADGIVVTPTSWTDATTVAGQIAATVTFGTSYAGMRIGYRGKGKVVTGVLLENPITVVEDFLRNVVGLSASDFNATALETARGRAAGYKCAGVLDQDRSPATTVSEILSCFAGYYFIDPDGRIVLVIDDGITPPLAGLADHVRAHEMETADASLMRTDIINQVGINYTRNAYDITLQQRYQDSDDGSATRHVLSQAMHGASGPGSTEGLMEFPWCRDLTTIHAVQQVIVNRLALPRARIRTSIPAFRLAHLDVGDYVGFSWDRLFDEYGLPLRNQIGVIEEIAFDADNLKIDLAFRDTGSYVTLANAFDGSWAFDGSRRFGSERDRKDY